MLKQPMRISLSYPSERALAQYLTLKSKLPFSYEEVGATREAFPAGYQHDRYRFPIGEGEADWKAAKSALREWQHFNTGWTRIYPPMANVEPEQVVIVSFRLMGLWWKNPCRILSTTDQPDDYGFTYGTLTGHVERGEEYFGVSRDEQGAVCFVLEAFSQPDYWLARLAGPLTRHFQLQFAPDAAAAMRQAIALSRNAPAAI
ncbi:MAG: DUF1990 domain-containing protein [Bacteroidota bacterium]